MNYFKQIYFEMKHQKMMTWVSVSGTALAIFLVMIFVMSEQVKVIESAPESQRSRILYGEGIDVYYGDEGSQSSMGLSREVAKSIYSDLKGVEQVSYYKSYAGDNIGVSAPGGEVNSLVSLSADANIWKVYDYRFVSGTPFRASEAESGARKAVLSQSAARKIFGKEDVAGREIIVGSFPYTVTGVIKDPEPIMPRSYAEIIIPFNPDTDEIWETYFGRVNVMMLLKKGVDPASVKAQVEQRYKRLQAVAAKEGQRIAYHNQPYTAREMAIFHGSNTTPDTTETDRLMAIILLLLIILPAINLSSMTRSRMRHRISEIGVRRAFGAKRREIVAQIFGENFIMTLAGGLIGLILSFIFLLFFSNLLFTYSNFTDSRELLNARPNFTMLFSTSTFLLALLACLVINVLSASVPAWKASRVHPAEAIAASH